MNSLTTVLKINQISKSYKNKKVLDEVTLQIPKGSIFGIIGPNGSGKTTLLGIVLDLIKADSGQFKWINTKDTGEFDKKRIGALIETPNFYPYLTAENNLKIVAGIKQSTGREIDEVLEQVNLADYKKNAFGTFSLGMKQRLAIASCLIGDPDILIFDEPTNGLDPSGIADIRDLIKKMQENGKTVIISSHLLDEIEKICTHVMILNKGKLLVTGKANDVFNDSEFIEIGGPDLDRLFYELKKFPGINNLIRDGLVIKVFFSQGADAEGLFLFCIEKGIRLNHLRACKNSLESSFFQLLNTI